MVKILLILFGVIAGSCSEELDRRTASSTSNALPANEDQTTDFVMFLPTRTVLTGEIADISELMDSYYLNLIPEGDNCNQTEVIEEFGRYEDFKNLSFSLDNDCDYLFAIALGNEKESSLFLQSEVSYDTAIKSLMVEHCNSCHPEYETYEGTINSHSNIVVQVENGDMPPPEEDALTNFEIASFLGWEAAGFPNKNTDNFDPDSEFSRLAQIFFRNDFNFYIYSDQLKGRSSFVYEDSVWLQPDGSSLGLSTIELIFERYVPDDP